MVGFDILLALVNSINQFFENEALNVYKLFIKL